MFLRFVFVFVFIFLSVSVSFACTCSEPSVRQKVRWADVVFTGELTSFEELEKPTEDYLYYKAVFKVEKQWKGKKQSLITTLADLGGLGMCGMFELKVGEKYLIYAPRKNGNYLVSRGCAPHRKLKYADDEIKKLNGFWYRIFANVFPYPIF